MNNNKRRGGTPPFVAYIAFEESTTYPDEKKSFESGLAM